MVVHMKRCNLLIALMGGVIASSTWGDPPQVPFPHHTAYAPGTAKPSHRTQAQLDADTALAYDLWKGRYLVSAGTTPAGDAKYRITFGSGNPGRTVSEGMGYGMIAVALMAGHDPNAQALFDGLWRFVRANPSNIDSRLMAWEVPNSGGGADSAFDGDNDMAYALLLADRQWGSSTAPGAINYRAEFDTLAAGIMASTIGPQSRLPMLGDWATANGGTYNQWTPRSSDFTTAQFRAYARATGSPAWAQVVTSTQAVVSSLQANYSAATGLLPDFIVRTSATDNTPKPAPANFLEGANDGRYYYNAFRDPWRLATDALVNNDAVSMAQSRKMADWVLASTGGVPNNLRAGYTLAGAPVSGSNYFTSIVAAPFAVAAMTRPAQQAWLNALYDAVATRHEDYYEDSVTLLCLVVLSGNWWDPTLIVKGVPADLNHDGLVNGADLGLLLAAWNQSGGAADLNADGHVDGADLGLLLSSWS